MDNRCLQTYFTETKYKLQKSSWITSFSLFDVTAPLLRTSKCSLHTLSLTFSLKYESQVLKYIYDSAQRFFNVETNCLILCGVYGTRAGISLAVRNGKMWNSKVIMNAEISARAHTSKLLYLHNFVHQFSLNR